MGRGIDECRHTERHGNQNKKCGVLSDGITYRKLVKYRYAMDKRLHFLYNILLKTKLIICILLYDRYILLS